MLGGGKGKIPVPYCATKWNYALVSELRDSSWNNDLVFWCIEDDNVSVGPVSGTYGSWFDLAIGLYPYFKTAGSYLKRFPLVRLGL